MYEISYWEFQINFKQARLVAFGSIHILRRKKLSSFYNPPSLYTIYVVKLLYQSRNLTYTSLPSVQIKRSLDGATPTVLSSPPCSAAPQIKRHKCLHVQISLFFFLFPSDFFPTTTTLSLQSQDSTVQHDDRKIVLEIFFLLFQLVHLSNIWCVWGKSESYCVVIQKPYKVVEIMLT